MYNVPLKDFNQEFRVRYQVKEEQPLIDALGICYPESTRNTLRALIQDKRVLVNGKLATSASQPLTVGQQIEIGPRQLKKEGPLTIVFEDQHLIVVDKPSGLLSVATHFENNHTAHAILKKRFHPKKIFVVHRLDQETSGLLMFALSEPAYEKIKEDLAAHKVERTYYGVVEGILKGKGTWRTYLKEDEKYRVHVTEKTEESELAITHYEAELQRKEHTLVRFKLETGKKNQIRVHAAHAGHPIYGDKKYGAEMPFARRLYLHAYELRFQHPITKKELIFNSKLPKEFLRTLSLPKFP
jgi:23S rRNA pseudouridine1911/1915/1917 synthase